MLTFLVWQPSNTYEHLACWGCKIGVLHVKRSCCPSDLDTTGSRPKRNGFVSAESCGKEDPLQTHYVDIKEPYRFVEALLLVILSASSRLRYEHSSGMLIRQTRHSPDGSVLAAGIMTLLQQLPGPCLKVQNTNTSVICTVMRARSACALQDMSKTVKTCKESRCCEAGISQDSYHTLPS